LIPSRTLKTLTKATIWTAHRPFWIAPVTIQNSKHVTIQNSKHVTIHEQYQSLFMNSSSTQLPQADKRQNTIHEQFQRYFPE